MSMLNKICIGYAVLSLVALVFVLALCRAAARADAELQAMLPGAPIGLQPGLEAAARYVDGLRDDHDHTFGYQDPDTGAWEFGRGPRAEALAEHSVTLAEIADGIRGLAKGGTA